MLRGTVLKFAYRVYRKAKEAGEERVLLAEGETVHVSAGADGLRINGQLAEAA